MEKKHTLNQYKPNILIKIGVSINIIVSSILSILIFTLILTLPIIASSIYLLVPRTQVKRYLGINKIITIVLSLLLSLLIILIVTLAVDGVVTIYNAIASLVNDIIFWTKKEIMIKLTSNQVGAGLNFFNIIFLIITLIGPFLILIGWYNKKELKFEINLEDEKEI